jgi:hypothetical protein
MGIIRSQLLFSAGGDVLTKYGTLVRRIQIPARGGETAKEVFTRSTTATKFGAGSTVTTAAANIPRVEYFTDPVNNVLQPYLKLEPAATNSVLQSQALGTTWTNSMGSGGSITNNSAAAPDGTTTATLLVPGTASSNTHEASQVVTITANENIAFSVFVKASGYTGVQIVVDAGSTFILAWADLTAGTITSNGSATASVSIVALASGWYWLAMWGLPTASTSATAKVRVFDTGADAHNTTAYAGNGSSGIYAWGAQLERNGTTTPLPPTSYIATTTATVTRSVDNFSVPWPLGPQSMWFYVRYIERGAAVGSAAGVIVSIDGAGAAPRIDIEGSGNSYSLQYFNPSQFGSGGVASGAYGVLTELFATITTASVLQISSALNGGTTTVGTTGAGGAFPAAWGTPTSISLGRYGGGAAGSILLSRVLVGVGLGGSPGVTTLADARAAPY